MAMTYNVLVQPFFFEFTKLSFENLNRQIRLAENKAKFLLSLNLAVISGISALAYNNSNSLKVESFYSKEMLIMSLFVISIILLFTSCFFTVLIIIPKSSPQNNPSKLLYWGQVAQLEIDHIQDLYWNSSEKEKMQELINQIYFYSKTATQKYKHVRTSIYFLFAAVISLVTAIIAKSLIY
jgi:hypothetical protein